MPATLQRQRDVLAFDPAGQSEDPGTKTGEKMPKIIVPWGDVLHQRLTDFGTGRNGTGDQQQHQAKVARQDGEIHPRGAGSVLGIGHEHAVCPARLGALVGPAGAPCPRVTLCTGVPVHAVQRAGRQNPPRSHRGSAGRDPAGDSPRRVAIADGSAGGGL